MDISTFEGFFYIEASLITLFWIVLEIIIPSMIGIGYLNHIQKVF